MIAFGPATPDDEQDDTDDHLEDIALPIRVSDEALQQFALLKEEVQQRVSEHCDDLGTPVGGLSKEKWLDLVSSRVLLDLINATRLLLPELLIRGKFQHGSLIWNEELVNELTDRARQIVPIPGDLFIDALAESLRSDQEESKDEEKK